MALFPLAIKGSVLSLKGSCSVLMNSEMKRSEGSACLFDKHTNTDDEKKRPTSTRAVCKASPESHCSWYNCPPLP